MCAFTSVNTSADQKKVCFIYKQVNVVLAELQREFTSCRQHDFFRSFFSHIYEKRNVAFFAICFKCSIKFVITALFASDPHKFKSLIIIWVHQRSFNSYIELNYVRVKSKTNVYRFLIGER